MPAGSANRIRIPTSLDVATYTGITAMSFLGISGLRTLTARLIALGFCLLFGVLYHFFFRTGRYQHSPNIYFGTQAVILALVYLLGSGTADAFDFLFLLLAIHTAVVLPGRSAAAWIAIYYLLPSSIVLLTRGLGGLYAIVFYLVTYVVSGFFGNVLRNAELAREHNQTLVAELQATQQKLQELAVVAERNRLARDLHDSVKQQVFSISMQLSAARTALSETAQAYPSVVEAERLAQQASTELTALIQELRPPGLERRPLAGAIREHVQEWSRQNKMESEIRVEDVSVSVQTEQALFRVLQEALANVARHSKASRVSIELESEGDAVNLTIEDNGVGFDSRRITKGVGLDSMQERLIALNGTVDVVSERSKGTRVVAKVRRS